MGNCDHDRHALRDRERDQRADRADGHEFDRGGRLDLGTTIRSLLGNDLPLIEDTVTIEHLLAHRSGIGDYFDEEIERPKDAYILPIPVHELAMTEPYVRVLDGFPTKFPPGERFSYSNSGYVVLALLAERVSGIPFHDLVVQRVCEPASMVDTAFLRSDELPARTALGYIDPNGHRTNVLHLAVRGTGDGGVYTTAADMHNFWMALFAGRIVRTKTVTEMLRPRSDVAGDPSGRYGLGFWLFPQLGLVELHGSHASASFQTDHSDDRRLTYTVLSNTTEGAWPVSNHLDEIHLG
jgi:CubicO group peptidase (beta-lactamase class C family)